MRLECGWKAACHLRGILAVPGQVGAVPKMAGRGSVEERMRTIAQEKAHLEMMRELYTLEVDVRDWKLREALIPAAWHKIEETAPVRPRRKKLTVALDEDVLKWFQGLGEGYHRRINTVLRTFMLALISKEVLSRGDTNRHGQEIWGRRRRRGRRGEGGCSERRLSARRRPLTSSFNAALP